MSGLRKLIPKIAFPIQCRNSNSVTVSAVNKVSDNPISWTCLSTASWKTPLVPSTSPP